MGCIVSKLFGIFIFFFIFTRPLSPLPLKGQNKELHCDFSQVQGDHNNAGHIEQVTI